MLINALNQMIKVINLVSLLCALVLIAYQKPGQLSYGLMTTGAICRVIITGSAVVS